jgi:meiosis-specific APC/C activator protein AMA1
MLRDDFYCSILAYSVHVRCLAIGLGDCIYSYREDTGVALLNGVRNDRRWLTSLDWSSENGQKGILAYGRSDHSVGLLSIFEGGVARWVVQEASPVTCLSFRPTSTVRPSRNPHNRGVPAKTKDLLVGDETGTILYYVIEWPDAKDVSHTNWAGEMTLMARIAVHRQQICGLAWSNDATCFATGGNDNLCCLFEVDKILEPTADQVSGEGQDQPSEHAQRAGLPLLNLLGRADNLVQPRRGDGSEWPVPVFGPGIEKCRWQHGAAVKAIAFCPWQDGLVATGGGSHDKCIHFFHTTSGAALATISVFSQVTSLIWSTTRREIAATFGYAQPDHPIRIAVFSWPECRQVATIPWEGEHRALYAVPYPHGPGEAPPRSRAAREGCIVVAASDETIKFHEVWAAEARPTTGGVGMLGGSDILEDLQGIDKEGDVIR